jgi:hypothetical protein
MAGVLERDLTDAGKGVGVEVEVSDDGSEVVVTVELDEPGVTVEEVLGDVVVVRDQSGFYSRKTEFEMMALLSN